MSQKLKSLKYGCHTVANHNFYGDGFYNYHNKSAKWHCGRHTLICKKILIKKT